jgi:hypothetical protein
LSWRDGSTTNPLALLRLFEVEARFGQHENCERKILQAA